MDQRLFPHPGITLAILGCAVGAAVLLSGGVDPVQWNWCLVAIGLAAATARVKAPALRRLDFWLLGTVSAIAILQIIPLPIGLIGILSPARAELAQPLAARWATLTATPIQTAEYLLTLGAYLVLLLTLRSVTSQARSPWITVWPLLAIAALEAVLGLFQTPIAQGTYANRDHYAGLLEMVLPFAVMYPVAILCRKGSLLQACSLLALAALILVAILRSLSRMGFLAALAALFVCGVLSVRKRWLVVAVAAVVLLAFLLLPSGPLIDRFSDIADQTRLQIWHDTLGLVKAFPLFGCGLGGFESCLMRFKTAAPMNTVDYAHNDYMQILAEFGIVAFLAGVIFAARLLARTLRNSKLAPSADQRCLAIACAAAMMAMLLHSLVDFNLYVPANGAVFAWICGVAAASGR